MSESTVSTVKVVKKADVVKRVPTRSELQSELNDMKRRWNSFLQACQQKIDKWPLDPNV